MKLRIKINGIVLIAAFVFGSAFFYFLVRLTSGPLDYVLQVAGLSLVLLGQLLRVVSRGYKAESSRSGHALVTDGPYALVRNPMYLGIILIGTGVVLAVFELWVVSIFVLAFIWLYAYTIKKEEAHLLKKFKNEYAAYLTSVPRLFPRPGFVLRREVAAYLPLRLSWFYPESLSIGLVLIGVILVEAWVGTRVHGSLFLLAEALLLAVIACAYLFLLVLLSRTYETRCPENKDPQSG